MPHKYCKKMKMAEYLFTKVNIQGLGSPTIYRVMFAHNNVVFFPFLLGV